MLLLEGLLEYFNYNYLQMFLFVIIFSSILILIGMLLEKNFEKLKNKNDKKER